MLKVSIIQVSQHPFSWTETARGLAHPGLENLIHVHNIHHVVYLPIVRCRRLGQMNPNITLI